MLRRSITAIIVLSFLMMLAGCDAEGSISVTCNQVKLTYPSIDDPDPIPDPLPIELTYLVKVYLPDTTTVVGQQAGKWNPAGGTIIVPLNQTFPSGTQFDVEFSFTFMDPPVTLPVFLTQPCSSQPEETWFDPGDARINRQAYAGAAVYCDAAEKRVGIYGVNQDNSQGFPAIFVPYDQLPPVPPAEAGHTLIATYGNIRFYRLTTGEYQINVGPDAEGKEYIAVWDGCPQTVVKSYIFQGGTQTMTEIYPRD